MNLKVNYFENSIKFKNDSIQVFEIENKKMFFRFVNDLYEIKNANNSFELYFYDDNHVEINLTGKIEIYTNYFDLDINSKKNINYLSKIIAETISDEEKNELFNIYKKMYKNVTSVLKNIDLPLTINNDISIEDVIKFSKVSIVKKSDLLDNLFLIIDLEKILKLNSLIFFVNLKQYLNKEELVELYKYSIYNNVNISLIDSQSYGTKLDYENKLIIDSDLEEFMI